MNAVELLDESAGACTGGNFPARSLRVKQHGAILGMQMHRNRTRVQHSIVPVRRARGKTQMCNGTSGNPRISIPRHRPFSSDVN
ncbi:hypothetical protein [Bradyrhizobium sp.]|uniref:hypothetical protein n=1 Tax=Bradyrhizobium sp. TaxID=376 RepID=UPI003C77B339